MENFIVTIKGVGENEPYTVKVSKTAAGQIKRAMDAKTNCYIGDEYLPFTRILGITEEVPEKKEIGASANSTAFCGKCEQGWLFRIDDSGFKVFYPCSCNQQGKGIYSKNIHNITEWEKKNNRGDPIMGRETIVAQEIKDNIRIKLSREGGSEKYLQAVKEKREAEISKDNG